MRKLIEPPTTGPTPAQAARIRQVHDLAAEFATLPADQRLPYLVTVVRTQTSGYDRFKTIQHTAPESPLFAPLMALVDALVLAEDGTIDTKHGIFTRDDIAEAEALVTRGELVFPVRHPWAVKPVVNEKTNTVEVPGVRAKAVYRTAAERLAGPEHKPFMSVLPPRPADDDDDPWRVGA